MNLCLVSREFPPFTGGGIGAYSARFAGELARRGHGVVVVTVSADGARTREDRDGVTVVRLPLVVGDDWSRPAPEIATPAVEAAFRALHPVSVFAMQLPEVIAELHREFRFNAVEVPDCGAAGWFLMSARRVRGLETAPVLVHLHSPTAWINEINRDPSIDGPTRALIAMERDCLRWADGLVCPSRGLAKWVEGRGLVPPGGVTSIPLPLGELEDLAPATAPTEGPLRLLFVGRLEPRKGVDVLFEGARRSMRDGADLRIDAFGRDITDPRTGLPFGRRAHNRLPPRIRPRVLLHGQAPPEEIWARDWDLAVVPSPDDNFPYTCVEAMARGLPILATRAGGMAEMVRDGVDGVLVGADPDAWARALGELASWPRRRLREMGASAAERIRELCGNDRVIAERCAHIERVIKDAAPPPSRARGDERMQVLRAKGASAADLERLREAVRRGADAAIGWERNPDGSITALPPPQPVDLASGLRLKGPLAIHSGHSPSRAGSPLEALLDRALAGGSVAVVPEAVFEVSAREPPPAVDLTRLSDDDLRRLTRELLVLRAGEGGFGVGPAGRSMPAVIARRLPGWARRIASRALRSARRPR